MKHCRMLKLGICLALLALFLCSSLINPSLADTADAKAERLAWWTEARFGMFIHWGLYAELAGEWKGERIPKIGEWIMYNAKIPVKEYETLAPRFNPVKFDADEWVRLAKAAGMKYMVITAKHCDGFAMFRSENPYNIVDATPFKRDVCGELRRACRRHGVKLGFYYSHCWDWHEPNAMGLINDWDFGPKSERDFEKYLQEKAFPQVEELVTQYDPAIIWFDVPSDITLEQGEEFKELIRQHQPDCIINDRLSKGKTRGDYHTPEQYIPDDMEGAFEVCMTLNDTWGYKWYDYHWKSAETVIQNLVDITSKGGNYLLNVGPTGEGLIPPASVRILQEVGKWMEVNGESIYGTQASPLGRLPFHGRCTAKPGKLYIHVFDWPLGRELIVPGIKNAIPRVYLLADPDQILLPFEKKGDDLVLQLQAVNLDEHALHPADTVIVVEYEGELQTARQRLLLDRGFTAHLTMDQAAIDGDTLRYEFSHKWDASRGYQIFDWTKVGDAVVFDIRTIRGGAYDVFITYGAAPACKGNAYALTLGEAAFSLEVQPTGGFYTYNTYHVGEVKIENPGDYTLRIEPEKIGEAQLMNLKGIKLIPIVK